MKEPIHVIGHKNRDTDSICSAIGYAYLRNALGDTEVRPARADELNSGTRCVLERFSLPIPDLLTSATGRRMILVDHNEVAQTLDDTPHGTPAHDCLVKASCVEPALVSLRWHADI